MKTMALATAGEHTMALGPDQQYAMALGVRPESMQRHYSQICHGTCTHRSGSTHVYNKYRRPGSGLSLSLGGVRGSVRTGLSWIQGT